MSKITRMLISAAALSAVSACSNETTAPVTNSDLVVRKVQSETGNGAPSGFHYTLNIIGMGKEKTADMNATGSAMFVRLGRTGETVTTKIMLTESTTGEFAITDKNGTDGEAGYTLPAPGAYEIYVRALGKPGGSATLTTCAEGYVVDETQTADEVCSTENKVYTHSGRPRFENVTDEMTTIVISESTDEAAYLACGGTDTESNTGTETVVLFDDCLYNYFWKYDNNGLRILQVRIYPVAE